MNYYNEFDPNAAAWLRELIAGGLIPPGEVDERSITDVSADDLRGFTQCHFFAGIAGWSYALQLAGWDANHPVWTGSCPCQAFSTAGKQKGFADERDLWSAFFNLIKKCRPEYIFGEQVENAIKHGWLDRVYRDMEAEGYSCGSVVLGAHSIGAPHQRQRLYWGCTLADIPDTLYDGSSSSNGLSKTLESSKPSRKKNIRQSPGSCHISWISDTDTEQCYRSGKTRQTGRGEFANGSNECYRKALGNHDNTRFQATGSGRNKTNALAGGGNDSRRISHAPCQRCGEERSDSQRSTERAAGTSFDHVLADNSIIGSKAGVSRQNTREERQSGIIINGDIQGSMEYPANDGFNGVYPECGGLAEECGMFQFEGKSYSSNPWERYQLIYCQDGAVRRIPAESVFFGVADGIPEGVDGSGNGGISEVDGFPLTKQKEGRPMLLKGYGNAIVPQVAAEFIKAFIESIK